MLHAAPTLEDLLSLPSSRTLFNSLPKMSDGSPDLRFLPGIGAQMERTDSGWKWNVSVAGSPSPTSGFAEWFEANQTAVVGGVVVLVVLAVMKALKS